MTEIPAGLVRAEGIELSGVKRIEGFKANLQGRALVISREGNSRKVFEERDITIVDARAVNVVAGTVAEFTIGDRRKSGSVDPFSDRLGAISGVTTGGCGVASASAFRWIPRIADRQMQDGVEL